MPRQSSSATTHDDGWLITPRALTSVATVVGLVYTLHAPVRYVLHVGATVDALSERVATLEAEVDHQRGTTAAAANFAGEHRPDSPHEPRHGPAVPADERAPIHSTATR